MGMSEPNEEPDCSTGEIVSCCFEMYRFKVCLLFEAEKQEYETIDDMLYKFLAGFIKSKEYINKLSQITKVIFV